MEIYEILYSFQDTAYGNFQSKLIPNLPREKLIGVRIPKLREIAKAMDKPVEFLNDLPHTYHEENMLHVLLLSQWKDYGECIGLVKVFLPYVNNWAACDSLRPGIVKKHLPAFLDEIRGFLHSPHLYARRFAVEMLMAYYLDAAFTPDLLELPARLPQQEYYEQMVVAWYFATALAKQWEAAIPYIEQHRLPEETHRRVIQKARESFRISPEQKAYLNTLKPSV